MVGFCCAYVNNYLNCVYVTDKFSSVFFIFQIVCGAVSALMINMQVARAHGYTGLPGLVLKTINVC